MSCLWFFTLFEWTLTIFCEECKSVVLVIKNSVWYMCRQLSIVVGYDSCFFISSSHSQSVPSARACVREYTFHHSCIKKWFSAPIFKKMIYKMNARTRFFCTEYGKTLFAPDWQMVNYIHSNNELIHEMWFIKIRLHTGSNNPCVKSNFRPVWACNAKNVSNHVRIAFLLFFFAFLLLMWEKRRPEG